MFIAKHLRIKYCIYTTILFYAILLLMSSSFSEIEFKYYDFHLCFALWKNRFPTCFQTRFWNRLQKPYPACKKHSFSNLFFGLLLSVFCLLRRGHLFVTHDLLSPFPFTIYGHLLACLWGCFTELFQNPSTIIGHFPYPLAGCFKKFTVIYFTFTIIGHFRYET